MHDQQLYGAGNAAQSWPSLSEALGLLWNLETNKQTKKNCIAQSVQAKRMIRRLGVVVPIKGYNLYTRFTSDQILDPQLT